jgi:hypothetical protein
MRIAVVAFLLVMACKPNTPIRLEASGCGSSPTQLDTIRIVAPDSAEAERLAAHQVRPSCAVAVSRGDRSMLLTRPGRPVLAVRWLDGADPRDALDAGADALLTGDPRTLDYARARAEFEVSPLPWDRTYVIVMKRGTGPTWAEGPGVWRDAMPGDAQPTATPFWWHAVTCPESAVVVDSTTPAPRMVYLRGDTNGRGLAERFVARGASLQPRDQREKLVALPAAELAAAVAAGHDYAVTAIRRTPGDACAELLQLGLAHRTAREVIPMLDTRLHLIVRRGRFGVSLDGDGIPVFDP